MKNRLILVSALLVIWGEGLKGPASAVDSHKHEHEPAHKDPTESEHQHEDRRIGPHKGVIEASPTEGFRLHPNAQKNFQLETIVLRQGEVVTVPRSALVYSGPKTQVFRWRNGYWKAIEVVRLSQTAKHVTVKSPELLHGDALAVRGLGFLKIVEQSITAPLSDSHVH